ncbi:tetratricopeptide repeat protein [cf. Phormidesmis sp. LEGE 11477]|uniref:tetratricopeptide repeat protein n=1 Tax=cf. Phormidesmis sp. LEGE 11477 TaxID=1828680 RepID=UPI00187F06C7|nr:hypothetical protein [cf. Phormidesmis sp. LEGE 11477]MBE9061289.1 hypothetical protein [cf. Phormidesmis sp. LEGE 11477]
MIAVQPKSRQILGVNQQAYQALKSALSLNLRRQLLVAVCDSVILQERLATQLEDDIALNGSASFSPANFDSSLANSQIGSAAVLDRLIFEPEDAHLPRQVVRRIQQIEQSNRRLSQLQVLGIEQMTRQSAIAQNYFLRSLEKIDTLLPRLNTSLLVWVSWPWLRTIQESAPAFWQWRNGVYEFVSDPTPTPARTLASVSDSLNAAADARTDTWPIVDLHTADPQIADEQIADEQVAVNSRRMNLDTDLDADTAQWPVRLHGEIDEELGEWEESETESLRADSDLITDQSAPIDWQQDANNHFSVGYQRRRSIEAGDRTLTTIESAISAYEAGLQCVEAHGLEAGGLEVDSLEVDSLEAKGIKIRDANGADLGLSSCLNDLGTLYWLKAQQLDDPQQTTDCMVQSIQIYSRALEQQDATMSCQIYSNIGAVYSLLATYGDSAFCLQQAAAVYNQAIMLSSSTETPLEHATLCNSLGSVYWKLSHHDQTDQHLRLAIGAYQEALSGYDLADHALDYAAVQNNLGIARWSLAKHEASIDKYEQAIGAYQEALVYRTAEIDPAACAATYNNLALVYWDLAKENAVELTQKLVYQQAAIAAFNATLKTAEDCDILSDMDTAAIYHCLGDVHMQMLEFTDTETKRADALQKSLHSYIQSIAGLTEDSPLFQPRLAAILANLQFHYEHKGLPGQQAALNQLPPWLIPYVVSGL